jgi:hypothetical protein
VPVEDATEMANWPQFQHKTEQLQGDGGVFQDDGGGLAVLEFLPVLRFAAAGNEVCNQAQDGTIRP